MLGLPLSRVGPIPPSMPPKVKVLLQEEDDSRMDKPKHFTDSPP